MAAPIGNEYWKLHTKHGRDKLFKTPDLLWEAACEYFQWTEDNPLIEIDYVGKDATKVEKPHTRPLTIQGLCIYLDVNTLYFNDFEDSLKGKEDELSKAFSQICTRIRQIIYRQKFDGAACGFYNHAIIARELGLVEQSTVKMDVNSTIAVRDEKTAKDLQDLITKFEEE